MTKRCEVCNLDLQDEYAYQGHMTGKKHLKNAQQAEKVSTVFQRSIFVSRVPTYITPNELLHFFCQFGQVVKHRFGSGHLIIEYKNKDPVDYLLQKPIYFRGAKLNVKPRILPENGAQVQRSSKAVVANTNLINDTEDLLYDNIKSLFEIEPTFDEQLAAFLDKISISDSEIQSRYETTCERLNDIFRSAFPKGRTYRFGSTVTGLGFKNCDLDIYFDTGFPVCQDKNHAGPNVLLAANVFAGIKRILFAKSALFSKVVPIPKAKTPIIKFIFIPTKISCDISFKNSLAVHNSQLVKFILSIDPRLRPTMMVLKYWVSNYELKISDRMSKYALTMLFIFYLQQPSVKLVPPILDLKKECRPRVIEGWQVNFNCNFKNQQVDGEKNNISIPDLLIGFFDFYTTYDFKENVICPLDGNSHKRTLFENAEELPECMDRYRKYLETKENPVTFVTNKPVCVQDPIELNHNLTANVSAKYLECFRSYCSASKEVCLKSKEKDYAELLPSLFSTTVKIRQKEPNVCFLFYADGTLNTGLPDDFESRADVTDKESFIRDNWFDLAINVITKYFEKVMKFEVQVTTPTRELKQQKIETESDVHSNDQDKVVIQCSGKHCLWRDRKGRGCILDPSMSMLEKEIQLSDIILQDLSSKKKQPDMKIDFDCCISKKSTKAVHLIVTLRNKDSTEKLFSEAANFWKNKIPIVVTKTLVHMQQFKKKQLDF
ncbi:hypothetical protein QAD02_001528 [Eretmocerus hayati]|uniref:Uncharacterized protein n=1 Tax=Eretmocerus hayati TaxID=131215 RepID=A0ACC2NG90_9HYME|nr:hypothetical protein QAD02_001528 [Eretmocerus hayati]